MATELGEKADFGPTARRVHSVHYPAKGGVTSLRASNRRVTSLLGSRLGLTAIVTLLLIGSLAIWWTYSTSNPSGPNTSGPTWKSGVSYPEINGYSNAAADATSAFGTWRNTPVEVAVAWPDRRSWANFTRPNAFYANWAKQKYAKVFALPLFPANIGDTITGCIAGEYNSYWRTFARTMKNSGLAAEGSIIRLGWEMNLHTDWGTPTQFAACWRNIVSTVKAIAPGLRWDWNVNRGTSAGMPGDGVLDAYPGDAYVNIVGVDSYDAWPPANISGGWQQQLNGRYGLNYWLSFAKDHGKKLSVPEWGIASNVNVAWDGHVGGDDPSYIKDMYDFFAANSADIAFESYFNSTEGGNSIYDPTQNPNSAAEYLRLWNPAAAGAVPGRDSWNMVRLVGTMIADSVASV